MTYSWLLEAQGERASKRSNIECAWGLYRAFYRLAFGFAQGLCLLAEEDVYCPGDFTCRTPMAGT